MKCRYHNQLLGADQLQIRVLVKGFLLQVGFTNADAVLGCHNHVIQHGDPKYLSCFGQLVGGFIYKLMALQLSSLF